MRAFHGDPKIKEKYLARVAEHMRLDQVIQGFGWSGSRGCAVGCTLDAYDHSRYPVELGIPKVLAHLEDRLHEVQGPANARRWPHRFLAAIAPGADLSEVWPKFAVWMLIDERWGVRRLAGDRAERAAIERVAKLYSAGGTEAEFKNTAYDVWRAAGAADCAAGAAVWAAAWAAEGAAQGAVRHWSAAWAARTVPVPVPESTGVACDKLLELLAAAPVVP
jgi:hypothetical protein